MPDPGVGPVVTDGGGRPWPKAMEGVRPEISEEAVETEESVSVGMGGSLSTQENKDPHICFLIWGESSTGLSPPWY